MSTATATAELQDVRGPSAFGGDRERFWSLLWLISVTEFRATYTTTVLGYVWTILRPLIYFGVILVVMREVLRFGENVVNYGPMLVLNIVLFQFFSETTTRSVRSVAAKEAMVRKLQFPRIIIPLSVSLTAAYTLIINLLAVFPLLLVLGVDPRWTWLLIVAITLLLVLFATGLAMILSVAYVRSEDTLQVWQLTMRALFFATPILYPIEAITQESFRQIASLNPLAPLFEQARVWVIDPAAMTAAEAAGGVAFLAIPFALVIGSCFFGLWLFDREAPRVAETL